MDGKVWCWMVGWVGGWMDGMMDGRAILRIAYSNEKINNIKMAIIMSNELL